MLAKHLRYFKWLEVIYLFEQVVGKLSCFKVLLNNVKLLTHLYTRPKKRKK